MTCNNKFALITGGSSGLGLAIAQKLAECGYSLWLVSNQAEQLLEAQKGLITNHSVDVKILEIDLAQTNAASSIFEYANKNNIEVEVLINNAGFFFYREIVEADTTKVEQKILLHILTASLLCTIFGKQMKQKKHGYILNVCSISGYKSFPGIGHYGGTKAYLNYFTRSLHTELKPFGVKVTALTPGAINTKLFNLKEHHIQLSRTLRVMITPESAARAGVKALFKGRPRVIPSFTAKLMLILSILTPQWVIGHIWKRVLKMTT